MRALAALALLASTACADAERAGQSASDAQRAAPQELNVYIWTSYHSAEAISRFEAEFNAKVHIELYDNNEVILERLAADPSRYDVVVPTDYMVLALARRGLLRPLDEERLPNLKHLDPVFDTLKAEGGPRYNVAYLFGTTGIAWRKDHVAEPIDSWSALFDPRYKGHIVMLADMRETFGAALHTLGASINTKDPTLIEAAGARLQAQRELVLAYDSTGFAKRIQEGEAWLVHGYSGELARVARASGGTIQYVVPKEGCTLATDNLVVPAGAPHVELAHAFINFMLDPQVAALTSNATGYATANAAARPFIQPELVNDPAVFPPPELLNRCEPLVELGAVTGMVEKEWADLKIGQ